METDDQPENVVVIDDQANEDSLVNHDNNDSWNEFENNNNIIDDNNNENKNVAPSIVETTDQPERESENQSLLPQQKNQLKKCGKSKNK